MDFFIDAVQELCNGVARSTRTLLSESKDVMVDGESFQKFSKYILRIGTLLQALKDKIIDARVGQESTRAMLQKLESQIKRTSEIMEKNTGRSRFCVLINCRNMLSKMDQLAKEIAETVSLINASTLEANLSLKSELDQLVQDINSLEFKMAASTEVIASEMDEVLAENGRSQEHRIELLLKISKALGVGANVMAVRSMMEQLKREKEEIEDQKRQAEAFQLSQLIQLLYSPEMIDGLQDGRSVTSTQEPVSAFKCPLTAQVMEEPVAIFCGHSFEKRAIQEYFSIGEKTCPICQLELTSLQITPNISLRNSIQEWKHRNMDMDFNTALANLKSDDPNNLNKAIEDLQILLEEPQFRTLVTEEKLIPKIVESLKMGNHISKAALKCLSYLANHSDNSKEAIVEAGAVRRIVKMFYTSIPETDAIIVLLKVSENETLIDKIGNTSNCIPFLVSLLQNPNQEIAENANKVLQNLSSYVHFVIKMAEAGYLQPFLTRFSKGPTETQASMAAELTKMQLTDNNLKILDQKEFVSSLVHALTSGIPADRSACLQCIKKLSVFPRMAKRFVEETETIPALLCALNYGQSSQQVATEILTSIIRSTKLSDFQRNTYLQELQSEHNINLIVHYSTTCEPHIKAQLLGLLFAICNVSETSRSIVRADNEAVAHLFCCLDNDLADVRRQALKLIYSIAEDHSSGMPLPPSPAKETSIHSLVTILTSSQDIEERSTAAGIISLLPSNDPTVDDILGRSEALKAIREVICTMEDEDHLGNRAIATPCSSSLLENALAALLRYTEPTKPELQRQLTELELYPSLVRVLSRGSSLAKQRTAMALAHLSHSTSHTATRTNDHNQLRLNRLLPSFFWCCSSSMARDTTLCSVHGAACSSRHTFCLVKADAVRPLIQTLSDIESGAAEAAIIALDTLLKNPETRYHAAKKIVENNGVGAILNVLEKGSQPAKVKALDLFQKINENHTIQNPEAKRSRGVLIHLLTNETTDETLKKRVAIVLSQMDVIQTQSSYF